MEIISFECEIKRQFLSILCQHKIVETTIIVMRFSNKIINCLETKFMQTYRDFHVIISNMEEANLNYDENNVTSRDFLLIYCIFFIIQNVFFLQEV